MRGGRLHDLLAAPQHPQPPPRRRRQRRPLRVGDQHTGIPIYSLFINTLSYNLSNMRTYEYTRMYEYNFYPRVG